MQTILDILQKSTGYLESRGVDGARRHSEELLAHVLQCPRLDLYLRFEEPLPEEVLGRMRKLLQERGRGVPLQHLLGEVEFGGRVFKVDGRALIPRPETEQLVEIVVSRESASSSRLLDMGTGSGVIGLTLGLEMGASEVVLCDVSVEALSLARENVQVLAPELSVQFVESDLFTEVKGVFDIVVANLPYIPHAEISDLSAEVQRDPVLALDGGEDGMEVIRQFLADVPAFLVDGGLIALEVGAGQAEIITRDLPSKTWGEVEVIKDYGDINRFVLARKREA